MNNLLKKRKTFLVTNKKNLKKTLRYKKLGYKIILINKLKNKHDFNLFYKKIYKLGYSRMFIETGLTFLNSLIKNKTIHDLYIFKSNIILGKNGKNNDTTRYIKKTSSKLSNINLSGDKILKRSFNYV